MRYRISESLLAESFAQFRNCGRGSHECQLVWTSPWPNPYEVTQVVHPEHRAHELGFELDRKWLHAFWSELFRTRHGIRFQVHTHPRTAFHSDIDDKYPIIHSVGFLSLVIPDFGLGPVGLSGAYLAEIQECGNWKQIPTASRIEIYV